MIVMFLIVYRILLCMLKVWSTSHDNIIQRTLLIDETILLGDMSIIYSLQYHKEKMNRNGDYIDLPQETQTCDSIDLFRTLDIDKCSIQIIKLILTS